MSVVPCGLCGYDSAGTLCPHCGGSAREASVAAPRRGTWGGVAIGFAALPRGLHELGVTRGAKRWLLPPFLITCAAFALLFAWLWSLYERLAQWTAGAAERELPLDVDWLREALEWLLRLRALVWLANLASALAFLALALVAAFWAFSIVYEAVSGPFLDEIHARVETRWFGDDPRNRLYRPTALSPGACAAHASAAGAAGLVLALAWVALGVPRAWLAAPLLLLVPFVVLGLARREFGRWLWWLVRLEGGTLWVSLKAAAVAGLILLVLLPLKFVPGVGFLLFGLAAGFTTAVSLLDIPCERRRWSLRQRLAFLGRHLPAIVCYGSVASLLFVVPLIGPVLMVPAASVGGLWMLVRLDKEFLRRGRTPE
jgi:uncharacterized protein involved in cysteine biosynthesis